MRINVPLVSVLTLAVGLSFVSCASNPTESAEKSPKKEIIVQEPEVQKFIDWQYKGFGKEIPESAEKIFAWINPDSVAANGVIVEDNKLIAFGKGENTDQSVNVLEDGFEKHLAKYEEDHEIKELSLVEDYWVKVNQEVWKTDKPYMAIRVFEIN